MIEEATNQASTIGLTVGQLLIGALGAIAAALAGSAGIIGLVVRSFGKVGDRVDSLGTELRRSIDNLDTELSGKIDGLGNELRGSIGNLDTELSGRIDNLGTELRGKIDNLGTELRGKINTLTESNHADHEVIGNRIDEVRRELSETREDVAFIKGRFVVTPDN